MIIFVGKQQRRIEKLLFENSAGFCVVAWIEPLGDFWIPHVLEMRGEIWRNLVNSRVK